MQDVERVMNLILWLINNPNAFSWFRRLLPTTLDDFEPTLRASQHVGLDYLDAFLLFQEVRLLEDGANSEFFPSIAAWLQALGEAWQSNRSTWHSAIWSRLVTRRPVVNATFMIYEDGAPKMTIPSSFEEFRDMFQNGAIQISLN